jgi:hypothetical protein
MHIAHAYWHHMGWQLIGPEVGTDDAGRTLQQPDFFSVRRAAQPRGFRLKREEQVYVWARATRATARSKALP